MWQPVVNLVFGALVLTVTGCGTTYGCGKTTDVPGEGEADIAALQRMLSSTPDLQAFRAFAVHGHEAFIIDTDDSLKRADHRASELPGKLLDAWTKTFSQRHPNAYNAHITTIQMFDSQKRQEVPIASRECEGP